MLKFLKIDNFILIDKLELNPCKNLNIITGETGAGKSIILEAFKLLMGARYNNKALFNEHKKIIIEGVFDIHLYNLNPFFKDNDLDYYDELIIRREINTNNKSRIFINDTPIKISQLKILTNQLIDIHSQYDNFLLNNPNFQLNVLDIFADNINLREEYTIIYNEFIKVQKDYEELLIKKQNLNQDLDYKKFLIEELIDADLENSIYNNLEENVNIFNNSEFLKSNLEEISSNIENENHSLLDSLKQCFKKLDNISNLSDNYKNLRNRLESVIIELSDVSNEIIIEKNKIEINPKQLEELKNKLDIYYSLQKKHKVNDIESLKKIRNKLQKEIIYKADLEEDIKKAKVLLNEKEEILLIKAKKLSKSRTNSIKSFKDNIETLLKELEMKEAKINLHLDNIKPNHTGIDKIKILFSANKGKLLIPLEESASGGEISRLILCFKYIISGKIKMPTIIFDEIDTGISGEIAMKVASMIKKMSEKHQVFSITHLPQVAVSGNKHFFVYKDSNQNIAKSHIKELNFEERKLEIAKMIGGNNPSNKALETALEMLTYSSPLKMN
ncbi:MAG: DNA repair protein RecN [Bacteroidetes bacterium]|nr:DNA repair protein RecN [Bacteroidota bacterium]